MHPFPFLIVPGYTPRFGWSAGLHPVAEERLRRALHDFQIGLAERFLVTGGAVRTRECEEHLMRDWLRAHGIDAARIVVEDRARNTPENLRNAGLLMREAGAEHAIIVTNRMQDVYLGFPWRSSFHLRCLEQFGELVGELAWLGPMRVSFRID